MTKIYDVPATCKCEWGGTVGDCEPDVDGDGSLGCPLCLAVAEIEEIPMTILDRLDVITLNQVHRWGFHIEFNWRGFNICRPKPIGYYQVFGIRWWKPAIVCYELCGSTSTG